MRNSAILGLVLCQSPATAPPTTPPSQKKRRKGRRGREGREKQTKGVSFMWIISEINKSYCLQREKNRLHYIISEFKCHSSEQCPNDCKSAMLQRVNTRLKFQALRAGWGWKGYYQRQGLFHCIWSCVILVSA